MKNNNMGVKFLGDFLTDGNGRYKGTVEVQGVSMNYSIGPQRSGEYKMRGTISMIDPETGRVMTLKGAARRSAMEKRKSEGRPEREVEIRKNLYSKTSKPTDIRKAIERTALALFAENETNLIANMKKRILIDDEAFRYLVRIFGAEFSKWKSKSEKSRSENNRMLNRIGILLHCKVGEITEAKCQQVKKDIGDNWEVYFRIAYQFLEFLYENREYHIRKNPFEIEKYRTGGSREVSGSVDPELLSESENRKINQYILNNLDDGSLMGVVLVKEGGYMPQQACQFKWGDIVFSTSEPNKVIIHYQKPHSSGATHDFQAVVPVFGALALKKRQEILKKNFRLHIFGNLPVVSSPRDPMQALDFKELTALCRRVINRCTDQEHWSSMYQNGERRGAGVRLMLESLEARLLQTCQLDQDSVDFLMHRTLNSVTADSYSSFTSPSGQAFLFTALSRERGHLNPVVRNPADCVIRDRESCDTGTEKIEIKALDDRHQAGVMLEISNLEDDIEIEISAFGGCNFVVIPEKLNNNDA